MKKLFFFFVILLFINIIHAQDFPGETWTFNKQYEQEGWNESSFNLFENFLIDSTSITGLVIVHKGNIVFKYGDIKENSYIASCRKSILAMLYGKYVDSGQIDLNKSLKELHIDDVNKLSELEKTATIKDLISARSGVYLTGSNPGDSREFAPERNSKKPGDYWLYSNWDFNLAGHLFEQESGKNIYDDVEDQLAIPLNMQDWDKSLQQKYGDSTISKFPAYHMWFSTRDMARIGLLMLNNGKWKNTQVISENWIDEMTSQTTTSDEVIHNTAKIEGADFGYGYMWWLWENTTDDRLKRGYSAFGAYGQSISIFPEIDVVVAFKTKAIYGRSNAMAVRVRTLKKAVENLVLE